MASSLEIACGFAALILAIYYYYKSAFNYWAARDIRGPKPKPVIGNFGNLLLRKVAISDQVKRWYNEFVNEPMFGIYESTTPVLVINDMEIVKDILIRDFSLFANRGMRVFPKVEPLAEHLFTMEAAKWRPIRAKLSPIFTSGKLKEMFPLMLECSRNLEECLSKLAELGKPVECKELTAKFTTDVIGSCVFGINMNALSNEESEFRRMGRKVFTPCLRVTMREILRQFAPSLYKTFGHLVQQDDVNAFFINVVADTIKYRKENNVSRPDFINMLMDLHDHPEKMANVEFTKELLAAQAFVFFAAGFETSSSTIAHGLYELAQNQEVQDKLRKEIRESCEKHGEHLTYEQIKELTYLDMVFKETLRKYPILPMLTREAMENYAIKGTKLVVRKGTVVWIPACAIQANPNFYPNPDVFDPERFNEDAVAARHPMSYLPFGDGPRNCIGARFANYQSKLGLISAIRNFKVDVCEKTTIPYKPDPRSFVTTMREINLKITKV